MKKSVVKIIVISVIGVGVCIGGYLAYQKYKSSKQVSTSSSYYAVNAKKMSLDVSIQGTGNVVAGTSKDITSGNNGTIQDFTLNVGDKVDKGAKICTVYSDQVAQGVQNAQNKVNQVSSQISQAKPNQDLTTLNSQLQDAQNSLNTAVSESNAMTIYSQISGMVLSEASANGDSIQSGKAILTVVDPSSYEVNVSVDELDINKVKVGQTAQITFGAITGKTYEGKVKTISNQGTVSNNVTTYAVCVSITSPDSIKLGMTANVTIEVEKKDNVVAIPIEALIERNGKKYVMVSDGTGTSSGTTTNNTNTSQNGDSQNGYNTQGSSRRQSSGKTGTSNSGSSSRSQFQGQTGQTYSGGKLVEIQTGIQNDNYIEVTSGVTDGEKVLVQIPKVSTTSTTQRNSFGGMMGGGSYGGSRSSGNGGSNSSKSSSSQSGSGSSSGGK